MSSLQLLLSIDIVFTGKRENIWPTKCATFPLWPFIEKVCWLLLDFLQSKITVNTPGATLERFYRPLTEIPWNTSHRWRQPIAVGPDTLLLYQSSSYIFITNPTHCSSIWWEWHGTLVSLRSAWLLFSMNQVSRAMPLTFLKKYFYKTYSGVMTWKRLPILLHRKPRSGIAELPPQRCSEAIPDPVTMWPGSVCLLDGIKMSCLLA